MNENEKNEKLIEEYTEILNSEELRPLYKKYCRAQKRSMKLLEELRTEVDRIHKERYTK